MTCLLGRGDDLWVPKTCDTWADALQIAVGSFRVRVPGERILIRPEMG
jgi:hypothetical protein